MRVNCVFRSGKNGYSSALSLPQENRRANELQLLDRFVKLIRPPFPIGSTPVHKPVLHAFSSTSVPHLILHLVPHLSRTCSALAPALAPALDRALRTVSSEMPGSIPKLVRDSAAEVGSGFDSLNS